MHRTEVGTEAVEDHIRDADLNRRLMWVDRGTAPLLLDRTRYADDYSDVPEFLSNRF